MIGIDNKLFIEWKILADEGDEASIHSLWAEYGYDYETDRFLELCPVTNDLVPLPREECPDIECLMGLDDIDLEGEV